MYGWVHKCLKETIINLCGAEKWREICAKSGVEDREGMLEKTSYNDDSEYFAIIKATLELLPHLSEENLYNLYGDYFMSYIRKNGYEHYLRTFGDSLFEVINNVNKMHGDLATSMSKMKVPDIHCEECEGEDCFLLYYSSPRGSQLKGMLLGIVRALGRTYFGVDVIIEEKAEEGVEGIPNKGDTCVPKVFTWKVRCFRQRPLSRIKETEQKSISLVDRSMTINADQFHLLSPCHVVFNNKFKILQISCMQRGSKRSHMELIGGQLWDLFRPHAEGVDDMSSMSWDSFRAAALALTGQHSVVFDDLNETSANGKPYSFVGKLIFLNDGEGNDHAAVFLCSPNVNSLDEMFDQKASVDALKRTDACRLRMLQNEAHLRHFKDSSTEAETKFYEEAMAASNARKDLDAKKRLMMYISHEIRTPLSIVKFGFQLISSLHEKLESSLRENAVCNANISAPDKKSKTTRLPPRSPRIAPLGSVDDNSPHPSPRRKSSCNTATLVLGVESEVHGMLNELRSLTNDSEHSVHIAISILNDLLSYEKLQSGMMDVSKSFVSCSLVQSVAKEFCVEANYFKIDLNFDTALSAADQREILLYADAPKIGQVIRNYISNALKFTPKKGSVTVTMHLNQSDSHEEKVEPVVVTVNNIANAYSKWGMLRVGVLDTGIGIDKENHARVFNEMTQFSPNENQAGGGTGLGLYISRAIMEKHDGSVGFDSAGIGKGCYFYFDIPVYRTIHNSDKAITPTVLSRTCSKSSCGDLGHVKSKLCANRKILICDDSDLSRKMLRKVLANKGCKSISEAKNGMEAVEMIREQQYSSTNHDSAESLAIDCIFMDNNMPVLNGLDATHQIRQLGYKGLLFGVTGNVTDEDIACFSKCGADLVLHKPLEFSVLEQFLAEHSHCDDA